MKITEEQRKLLTERLLGESYCVKKYKVHPDHWERIGAERTFTGWIDFGAVVEKLKNLPASDAFWFSDLCRKKYVEVLHDEETPIYDIWLLNPERFCILVAEAIEEGVIK